MSPDGSSTVHIYTQTVYTTTRNKQYIEQQNNFGRVRAVPRLGELYPGICLTTEGKARKNLSQGRKNLSQGDFFENSAVYEKMWKTFVERRSPQMIQGGSNMTGTDLCVNKPHCAAAMRP